MAQAERTRGEEIQQRGDADAQRGLASRRGESPVERMLSDMDWMFSEMQRRLFGVPVFGGPRLAPMAPATARGSELRLGRLPQIEMEDTGGEVVLTAEIPGVDPKAVRLECREDVLTIRAEDQSQEEHTEEGARARRYARFFAQIALPPDVETERAQASVEHGMLTIRFPKQMAQENVRQIPVNTEPPPPQPRAA